jgi:hypothetical protein
MMIAELRGLDQLLRIPMLLMPGGIDILLHIVLLRMFDLMFFHE